MRTGRRDRARAVVALAAAAVGVALLVPRLTADAGGYDRPLVLVSGRDDHGALATDEVELLAAPAAEGEGEQVGAVADGTLVLVVGDDGGSWLQVATLDGATTGWVDDFHLRGTAHVVGEEPACPTPLHAEPAGPVLRSLRASEQVEVVDHHARGGEDWVGVRTLQGGVLGLVPLARVQELPGAVAAPGQDCAAVEPDPEAVPHRH